MIPFKDYFSLISEGYVNLIGANSIEDRKKYAEQVWNILQKSYEKIGGIKGNGFNSVEDMVQTIPFWKLYIQGGRVQVAVMYKDKSGRKVVAVATDGSPHAKTVLTDVMGEAFKTGWGEYSKGLLVFVAKTLPFDLIQPYLFDPQRVQNLLPDDEVIPIAKYLNSGGQLENSDMVIYKRYPEFTPYFYVRDIGGSPFLKIAMGTEGKQLF